MRSPAVETGVVALRDYLGPDAAKSLIECAPRSGELAAFEYPLPEDFKGESRTLRIGFPERFPDVPLDFAITPTPWLAWPHCMRKSLCLYTDGRKPSTASPEAAVHSAMRRASELVAFSVEGSDPAVREAEFAREVRSYWNAQLPVADEPLMVLGLPQVSGELCVLTRKPHNLLASDPSAITQYEKRQGLSSATVRAPAKAAFFLSLTSTPAVTIPTQSISAIKAWLKSCASATDMAAFEQWLDRTGSLPSRWILLRLPGQGVAIWALYVADSGLIKNKNRPYHRRAGRHRQSGSPVATKVIQKVHLSVAAIHVLDAEVAHSRNLETAHKLSDARVVIVGVGSLGSECAMKLARAGVGHMTLVDPDTLSVANLGRHVLGISDLGRFKVDALRRVLLNAVPSVTVQAFRDYVQLAPKPLLEALVKADLVLATTADWPSELFLWRVRPASSWAMIQTWSEPHARVGHVIFSPPEGASGEHLFDEQGRFLNAFSQWPNDGLVPLPACGESFVTGDGNRLSTIAELAASTAITALIEKPASEAWHYTVSDVAGIESLGGTYVGPVMPEGVRSLAASHPWPAEA